MSQKTSRAKRLKPLHDFLSGNATATITLTYEEIEEIVQACLPEYAKIGFGYWANSTRGEARKQRSFAWLDAGYRARVNPAAESVTFTRVTKGG